MASTTLVTFLLETPNPTSTVHLLGSWDNFSKAYPMTRDVRIGRRHWRGCFSFSNIICDGDPAEDLVCREGGLKMGGKYWYYYQLDSEMDYSNPCEPSTTLCPYLPGQLVNVLEVPMQDETDDGTKRPSTSSSSVGAKFTLNPEDKFLALKPPKLASKVRHAGSTPSIGGCHLGFAIDDVCLPQKLDDDTPSKVTFDLPAIPIQPIQKRSHGRKASPISAPITRRPSLWSLFRRESRSADETNLETYEAWQLQEYFSGIVASDRCDTSGAQGCLHVPSSIGNPPPADRPQSHMGSRPLSRPSPQRSQPEFRMLAEEQDLVHGADLPKEERPQPSNFALTLRTQLMRLAIQSIGYTGDTILCKEHEKLVGLPKTLALETSQSPARRNFQQAEAAVAQSLSVLALDSEAQEPYKFTSTDSSYASSHGFSPTWSSTAFTDSFSPCQGAQIASPTISDFCDCLTEVDRGASFSADLFASLRPSPSRHEAEPFEHTDTGESSVYQIPEADGSVLTLRDLPKAEENSGIPRAFDAKSGNDLVEAWNDGAQGVKTNFEEFFDDHSYLSNVIL